MQIIQLKIYNETSRMTRKGILYFSAKLSPREEQDGLVPEPNPAPWAGCGIFLIFLILTPIRLSVVHYDVNQKK